MVAKAPKPTGKSSAAPSFGKKNQETSSRLSTFSGLGLHQREGVYT